MSVHFFYNYREHLIKQLKSHYETVVAMKQEDDALQIQLDEAEEIVRKYFEVILLELTEVMDASNGEVKLVNESEEFILRFSIMENYIKFVRRHQAIEVEIGRYQTDMGMVETFILAYIIPGEKKCRTRMVGKVHEGGSFDENTINFYMREAFQDIIKLEEQAK